MTATKPAHGGDRRQGLERGLFGPFRAGRSLRRAIATLTCGAWTLQQQKAQNTDGLQSRTRPVAAAFADAVGHGVRGRCLDGVGYQASIFTQATVRTGDHNTQKALVSSANLERVDAGEGRRRRRS